LKYALEERGDEEGLIIQRDSTILSRSITKRQDQEGCYFHRFEHGAPAHAG